MSRSARGFVVATLLALLASGAVQAQDNPNFRLPGQLPGQTTNPAAFTVPTAAGATNPYLVPNLAGASGLASLSNPYLGGNSSASLANGGGYSPPYNPYFNPYAPYCDPYGGRLMGLAALTTANAQFYVTIQQGRIVNQQANQAMIDTRRKIFDQIRYERMSIPSGEEIRVRDLETRLNRSRRDPPLGEILSGASLNSLLNYLIKQQGAGMKGPRVDLDDDVLKHINVNTTGGNSNVGLLRDLNEGGTFHWPLTLQNPEFEQGRKMLTKLFPAAVQEVINDRTNRSTFEEIKDNLQKLDDTLNKNINDLTISQYQEARSYLKQLREGFKALQQEHAVNYFNKKWTAHGKTVAELVKYMGAEGLHFAPATQGDDGAYRALHNALNAYDSGIISLSRQ